MAPRALKLGTRRSALARAQSGAIARRLERLHPNLHVELVGIDTRGDRLLDRPLSTVDGKEFFTAEIDAALLRGEVDFTVHSYKDLSLARTSELHLAAVPTRELPHDVVLFAPDVAGQLARGEVLRIGSSSPRRASFVPEFLSQALPLSGAPLPPGNAGARVQLLELRGNVDSRLRRLREPRGSERHLDGVVLAAAGLARLWADESGRPLLSQLLTSLPRMVLPLSVCPSAPAQGALAIECRAGDTVTRALLESLDDAATRRAVQTERALLAQRGGGCQQRFGAVRREWPELGTLLYSREAHEHDGKLQLEPTQLDWTPTVPLPSLSAPIRAWDGSQAAPPPVIADAVGVAAAKQRLASFAAIFIAHRRALPPEIAIGNGAHVWVPGVDSWRALARRGVWVEGCADGLGVEALRPLLIEPWLQLPRMSEWAILTHREAAQGWSEGTVITTYAHADMEEGAAQAATGPAPGTTHVFWASRAQFERWSQRLDPAAVHACGPGKTYEQLRAAGVQNLRMFPHAQQWRQWLHL